MKAKQKILVGAASFGVVIVLFLVAVVYPVFQSVVRDHEKVLAYKTEFLQLEDDQRNSREFEMLSVQYTQEFVRLQNIFVDSKTPVAFFRFLDETTSAFGLEIEKAPGAIQRQQGDQWPSFEVRLAGRGLYADFAGFLQKIESALYLIQVKNVSVSARGELVEFSLTLKVFTK